LNGTTSLTFTITNPNTTASLSGVAFTDTFPTGLAVATPSNASGNCGGGTFTAVAGSGSVSLIGGSIGTSGPCTVSLSVTGTTGGAKNNVTGSVTSTNGGTGNTGSATLDVGLPPTISKAFGAATIPLNGSTSLTFTIVNPNAALALTGLAFSDSLPTGLVVASTPGAVDHCGGTFTAASGSTSVGLSGGSVAAGGSCTLSVSVTGAASGVKNNTTGIVSSIEGGAGTTSNTATVTVVAPPTISKSFGASSILVNGLTSLTFTIGNPNATAALTGVAFIDSLPSGLQVASSPGATNPCGGTFTATASSTSVSLSGGTIPAGGTCMLSVSVTGTVDGIKNNTTAAVSSANGGAGAASNTATLTVNQPPAITSANQAAFTLGVSNTFTVTTTGFPVPSTITEAGGLPAGVTFTNNGNGTATLSGTATTGGTFNITITASNGISPNATQRFTLTANGPLISLSPSSSLSFGSVYLGTETTKDVTVTNAGNQPLAITNSVATLLHGGDSREFIAINTCPDNLPAGNSCTIEVEFIAGSYYSPQTAVLSIMDNSPGSPQNIAVTASVIYPAVLLSPASLSFATQKQNTSSTAKAVTLTNSGLTALTINSITIAGQNPADFTETNNCPSSLNANASCTIDVTFKPLAKGSLSGSVVITDNAQNSPQSISLSGTGN
jgi:hypothetical protein